MPKYICDDFNTLCTELGLECLITMDPRAYDMNYAFKNRGPHTVALFTDDWFELVPPNGDIVVKMPSDDSPWMAFFEPNDNNSWMEFFAPLYKAELDYEAEYGIKGQSTYNKDGNIVTIPVCDCEHCCPAHLGVNRTYPHPPAGWELLNAELNYEHEYGIKGYAHYDENGNIVTSPCCEHCHHE